MSVAVTTAGLDLARWDDLVRSVPYSDVTQLSAWGDVRRAAGFHPQYVCVTRSGRIVGGALVLQRTVPVVGTVGYVPYGPLVAPGADRFAVVPELGAALADLAQRQIMFVQPPLGGDDVSRELLSRGFRPSQAGIAPCASIRVDLAADEEDLRAGLRKTHRRWTRRWKACGVYVRVGDEDDVATLARLLAATAEHQGFEALSPDYLQSMYRRLARDGCAHLMIGEVDGIPLAATLLTGCGGVMRVRLGGLDRESIAARLNVAAAVEWEGMLWARQLGYRWYDFSGVRDDAVTVIENGIPDPRRLTSAEFFKTGFGGTAFRYPTPVEYLPNRAVRLAYDLSRRWPAGRRLIGRAAQMMRRGDPTPARDAALNKEDH